MKKPFHFLLFLQVICLDMLHSQDQTAQIILKHASDYYKSQESGKIVIHEVTSKSALSEDTTYYRGELFFWNDSFDIHSNNRFLVLHEGKFIAASDIEYYYYNLNNSIQKTATQNPDAEKELKSNSQRSNLLPKFIIKRQTGVMDPSLVEKAIILRRAEENNGITVIEVRDSFPNTMGDKAGRKNINLDIRIYINSVSYAITKMEEWVHIFEQPQYRAMYISEVFPISKKETIYCDSIFATFSEVQSKTIENNQDSTGNISSIRKGDILKDFRLPAINSTNTALALSDFSEGLIILDFWYKACYPCLLAMPKLEEIHQHHLKDRVFVLGVNPYDKNKDNLLSFLTKRDITYPTLLDESGQVTKDLSIQAFPTILVLEAKTKKIVEVFEGYSEDIEKEIEEIIQANSK